VNRVIDEWCMFKAVHPNTLLIGSDEAADAVIAQHLPYLRAPLGDWRPRAAPEPEISAGTLVIRDVDTLDAAQQEHLFDWLDRHSGGVQVVSVTETPLFPLVAAGAFLDKLYYRLNVVCMPLSSDDDTRGARRTTPFVAAHVESEVPQLTM
jgi:hypothetical protein